MASPDADLVQEKMRIDWDFAFAKLMVFQSAATDERPGLCKYWSQRDGWSCPERSTTPDGLCILHDPNPNKDVNAVIARVNARLADERENKLRFDGSVFPEGVSFREFIFRKATSFFEAEFHGKNTSFFGAKFLGETTDFGMCKFLDSIEFGFCQFRSRFVNFYQAEFHGEKPSFGCARFDCGGTNFGLVKFHQNADFISAEFYGLRTEFRDCEFHGQAFFTQTQFLCDETSFKAAKFLSQEPLYFHGARFKAKTVFEGLERSQVFLGGPVDFDEVRIDDGGSVIFDSVDLSKTEFLHVDLSKMKFSDVTWDHRPDHNFWLFQWGRWRSRIYDEALWRAERAKNQVEADENYLSDLGRIYRSLEAYYREAGELGTVAHFHYGVMEVQWYERERKARTAGSSDNRMGRLARRLNRLASWESAYRFSCGYGEDYARALAVLIVMIVLFGCGYWFLDTPGIEATFWGRGINGLLYSIQTSTLGRVELVGHDFALRLSANLLRLLESIVVPVQLGLFAFALRNRFHPSR